MVRMQMFLRRRRRHQPTNHRVHLQQSYHHPCNPPPVSFSRCVCHMYASVNVCRMYACVRVCRMYACVRVDASTIRH